MKKRKSPGMWEQSLTATIPMGLTCSRALPHPTSEPITPCMSNEVPHLRVVRTTWVNPGPSLPNPVGFTAGSKAIAALKTQLGGREALKPAWRKAAHGQVLFVGAAHHVLVPPLGAQILREPGMLPNTSCSLLESG